MATRKKPKAGETKSYIVVYAEEEMKKGMAARILGRTEREVADGVDAMMAAVAPKETLALHFDALGCSAMNLTDKEADDLRNDKRVAGVVEDVLEYAHDGCMCGEGDDGDADAFFSLVRESGQMPEEIDPYTAGYEQALGSAGGATTAGVTPGPVASDLAPSAVCPPGYVRRCFRFWGRTYCFCVPGIRRYQPIGWNIDMVRADDVWRRVTGRGVKVAILDTGIDENHPDLTVAGGASFVPNVGSWDDDQGHGTHCAGIVAARNNHVGVVGVAPGASLYAVKVLSAAGSGYRSWILAGMDWARREGMDVVSMSLGSPAGAPDDPCVLAYDRAARNLRKAGALVVSSAGNNGHRTNHWVGHPARCPEFMAVAAVDQNKSLAYFSSHGPSSLGPKEGVEIAAPGVSVNSTTRGGGYGKKSGTSMACPHVAGAAALLKEQHPTWTPEKIRSRLRHTAADLGAPGDDEKFGSGLLDCHRAVFG